MCAKKEVLMRASMQEWQGSERPPPLPSPSRKARTHKSSVSLRRDTREKRTLFKGEPSAFVKLKNGFVLRPQPAAASLQRHLPRAPAGAGRVQDRGRDDPGRGLGAGKGQS